MEWHAATDHCVYVMQKGRCCDHVIYNFFFLEKLAIFVCVLYHLACMFWLTAPLSHSASYSCACMFVCADLLFIQ